MKKIIVYTTPTCAFCPAVKNFIKEKGADYEEVDVTENEKAMEEMVKKTGQMGVPVTLIGDEAVVGFDKKKLEKLLDELSTS